MRQLCILLMVVIASGPAFPQAPCGFVNLEGAAAPPNGPIRDLLVFDDGSGPRVFAGGMFQTAGGQPASHIAAWNGSVWGPVGTGLPAAAILGASDLILFDDGSGTALYAGGYFGAQQIGRWNGSIWSFLPPPATGPFGRVKKLAVFNDGSGPRLHAVTYETSGRHSVRKWTGAQWLEILVFQGTNGTINDVAVFDDGMGAALFVAGGPDVRVTRWNGSVATQIGPPGTAHALEPHSLASGPVLAAGFAAGVATRVDFWNGSSWIPSATLASTKTQRLHSVNLGVGSLLLALGVLQDPMTGDSPLVEVWTGAAWSLLGGGAAGATFDAAALVPLPGASPKLYLGGQFGGVFPWNPPAPLVGATNVAAYDGTWSSLGTLLDGPVLDLQAVRLNGTRELFVSGAFSKPSPGILRWNGQGFADVGGGLVGDVGRLGADRAATSATVLAAIHQLNRVRVWNGATWALAGTALGTLQDVLVREGPSGADIYVCGNFTSIDGVVANRVARFSSGTWTPVGTGLPAVPNRIVWHDDGTGPALYVATNQGVFKNGNGQWVLLPGVGPVIFAIEVHDGGMGPDLYISASDSSVSGNKGIFRLDGGAWTHMGSVPAGAAVELASVTNAPRTGLFAGGDFSTVSGIAAPRFAHWDGSIWDSPWPGPNATVRAIEAFDFGNGTQVVLGGDFASLSGTPASRIGAWYCPGIYLATQQPAPGAPVTILNTGLTPGLTYYNLFSYETCPGVVGSGPILGLCATTPAGGTFLLNQILLPTGSPPIHFAASAGAMTFGPFAIPPGTYEGLCLELPSLVLSPVIRVIVN